MSDFTILVRNKSGARRQYFIFVDRPILTAPVTSSIFSNVYASAAPIPTDSGTAQFRLKRDTFAITGTNPGQSLGSGVNISTSDFEIAKLASGDKLGSTVFMTAGNDPPGKGAEFVDQMLAQDTSVEGGFTIVVDGSFRVGNGANQFIGLGAQDPYDPTNIIPVATVPAEPNTKNIFMPRSKYYISWGTYSPGQIIDVTTIATPAEVDFTGKAASLAKVVHNNDGTWSVTFN